MSTAWGAFDWQGLAGQVTQTIKEAAAKVDESLDQAFKEAKEHSEVDFGIGGSEYYAPEAVSQPEQVGAIAALRCAVADLPLGQQLGGGRVLHGL
jgi:hypothetical protein